MNPYLKALSKFERFSLFGDTKKCIDCSWTLRESLVSKFSWAIPDRDAINTISKFGPIIEIGAGKGYWAKQISRKTSVVAYDAHLKSNRYTDNKERFFEVKQMPETKHWKKLLSLHNDRTLFLCWPPYQSNMAYKALKAYTGDHFIYVGESHGGCTGNDRFHEELAKNWEEIINQEIPHYRGLHDSLYVYKRKKKL